MLTYRAFLTLVIFCAPFTVLAQLLSSLPECIQQCIEESPDTNCEITDIGCLCRASAGNFLTDTVICMKHNCDNNLNVNLLLAPIQLACDIAGAPIPESAIENAEGTASSVSAITMTVTQAGSTVSVLATSVSISTLTTDLGGHTTIPQTTKSTPTESVSSSSASNSHEATSSVTTTGATKATSSSTTSTKPTSTPSSSPDDDASDSAPFKNTNSGVKSGGGNLLGLAFFLMVVTLWN